ncbi:Pleurocidin-like peptide WF3 Precursor [Channa argus]|uniref:Pleurocidin-like peptide WF3 n=1 Tax=Channa argus TaxID=215402 RepID=A0A6G1QK30_CHAAH|nr:Pleurocidin-like peptide WF3 Precursor [Channa argus]
MQSIFATTLTADGLNEERQQTTGVTVRAHQHFVGNYEKREAVICFIISNCQLISEEEQMENKAMYLSTYEERENGSMYEEAYDGHNLSKLNLCDEGSGKLRRKFASTSWFFSPSLDSAWQETASIFKSEDTHLYHLRKSNSDTSIFSVERMKLTVAFLVLSMVVIMAEPGECFFGTILKGAFHVAKLIHGAHGQKEDQQEQLDTRSIDYNAGRPGYD